MRIKCGDEIGCSRVSRHHFITPLNTAGPFNLDLTNDALLVVT